MFIINGRIPMNEQEAKAVESLSHYSLTRRDPGNTGPIIAYCHDGDYLIYKNGRKKKLG